MFSCITLFMGSLIQADSLHKLQNENIELKQALQQAQSSANKSEVRYNQIIIQISMS